MTSETFNESELESALKKAFTKDQNQSILFDGHTSRNQVLATGINHGINKELLKIDEPIEESQYTATTYKLTQKGKEYFGLE